VVADADFLPALAADVRFTPTIAFFSRGKKVDELVGSNERALRRVRSAPARMCAELWLAETASGFIATDFVLERLKPALANIRGIRRESRLTSMA